MANLLGQNIGTNYKGILNLSTLNGNLSGTLQAVTDGDGNASPLRLSTTRVDVGTFALFGGTTNAFPALKRNGSVLEVRRADDSGYAPICAGDDSRVLGTFRVQDNVGNNAMIMYGEGISGVRTLWVNGSVGIGALGNNASARLQVDSTTQGFLPPRMTTAQRDAIASPAAGLVIYNTTTNVMNFFNGTVWGAF